MPGDSLVFDRAAEYYDATRGLTPETMAELIPLLAAEIDGPALEIGVGTGRIALPLAAEGVDVTGIDLSVPMMQKLWEKDPSRTVAVARADARLLPFPDNTFTTGIAAHVFHLMPDWRIAVDEMVRVLRPEGRILLSGRSRGTGPWEDIYKHMREILGDRALRPGADQIDEVEDELSERAESERTLPTLIDRRPMVPGEFIDRLGKGWYSFTWSLSDDELSDAVEELRVWGRERFGSLDRAVTNGYEVVWKVYELP